MSNDLRASLLALTILVTLVAGCGTMISYVSTNPPPQPVYPIAPSQVDVYTTGVPEGPYAEIGFMEAREGIFDDMSMMITSMREEAGRHGCDGIVITDSSEVIDSDHEGRIDTSRQFRAACIVYVDEETIEADLNPQPSQ